MSVDKRFALNCLLFATVLALICGAASIPIAAFTAFFGMSILGLVFSLRKAVKSATAAERPLKRFALAQAILGTLAFQIAFVAGFLISPVWDDPTARGAIFAVFVAGSIALAANLLMHVRRVPALRSRRAGAAGLAATGVVIAALLWAVREWYAFYLLYVLWIAQFAVGMNRLAEHGNARFLAALSLLLALMGLSVFLAFVNPFNVPRWDP